jgi:tetratricopeptide (TPR) repeat protein
LIRWQAGNFYLLHGNLQKMYECFKMACDYDIGKLRIAIQIAWKADPNHAEIDEKLIPAKLPARLLYLDFLVDRGELNLAIETWERSLHDRVPEGFEYHVSAAFGLIDRLLAINRVEDALLVWKEALQKANESSTDSRFVWEGAGIRPAEPPVNLVWNGSFEDQILRGGFDWRYSSTDEVEFAIDMNDKIDGLKSLRLTFGGTNIDLSNLRQIVPVLVPGSYLLEFYAKTENLTTDQRPYIVIQGVPEMQAVTLKTEFFPESSPWQKYSFPFTVKAGAKALEIVLWRNPSGKFDNRLKGSLWLDEVSIRSQDQQNGVHGPGLPGELGR